MNTMQQQGRMRTSVEDALSKQCAKVQQCPVATPTSCNQTLDGVTDVCRECGSSPPFISRSTSASSALRLEETTKIEAKNTTSTTAESTYLHALPSKSLSGECKNSSWAFAASKVGAFERILPVTVSERFGSIVSTDQAYQPGSRTWTPTVVRFGPLTGMLSMCLAIASIVASLGVLVGSNGASVLHWSASPPTYLAICTAVANLAMRYACIQGVMIAWWHKALRGSSFKKLHHDYRAGTTLGGALTSGRNLGLLGVACIASTLVVVDGPLLQRASTVVPAPIDLPIPLNVTMAAQIPTAYTGRWQTVERVGNGYNFSDAFNGTMPAAGGIVPNNIYVTMSAHLEGRLTKKWFFHKAPLSGVFEGCSGKCTAKMVAPALAATSCSSHLIPIDRHQTMPKSVVWGTVPPLNQDTFIIGVELVVEDQQEKINLVTAYATLEDCIGVLNYTACTLESAVGEYTVSIDNNTATVDPDSAIFPRILALSNNAAVNHTTKPRSGYHASTLGGIANLLWAKWDGYTATYKGGGLVNEYVIDAGATFSYEHHAPHGQCRSFSDPTNDMLRELNMLMVYTGMFAAEESSEFLEETMDPEWAKSIKTTIVGQQVGHHNVFHTNFHYFIAAAVVELVCIALIAPTYLGYWNLGRRVSFSPLEIAKAFQSPLLADCNSNSSGRDIANSLDESPVRYGAAREPGSEKTRLTFAGTAFVETPRKGERFDT